MDAEALRENVEAWEARLEEKISEVEARAVALSQSLKPSWAHPVERVWWSRHRQPAQLIAAFEKAQKGDLDALKAVGFSVRSADA